MRKLMACCVLLCACLQAGCGGRHDALAVVGGREITADEFRAAFENLPPAEQVEVLEPGGRLALLDRVIVKVLFEQALAVEDTVGASWWQGLYTDSWLASRWSEEAYSEFAASSPQELGDLARHARLVIVLLEDSASAAGVLEDWSAPSFEPPRRTALAPWSVAGSSFRVLEGPLFAVPPEIGSAMVPNAGLGPVLFPVYGAWAVAMLDYSAAPPETIPPGSSTPLLFTRSLRTRAGITPVSPAIALLADRMSPGADGFYMLEDLPDSLADLVLAGYAGGTVTAGMVSRLFESVRPSAFFGGIPAELSAFAPPSPSPAGPGVDLWFFVTGLAQVQWEVASARAAGIDPGASEVAGMASVEHMLRRRILEGTPPPDSSAILSYYSANRGSFLLPERRAVLLAYLPVETADSIGAVEDFSALSPWTPRDPQGAPVPTPPQTQDVFGPLGAEIFTAEPGAVSGPFEMQVRETTLAAYFQVVEVVESDTAAAADIWPVLTSACREAAIAGAWSSFVEELRTRSGVEIDTSAVEAIDPWSGSY